MNGSNDGPSIFDSIFGKGKPIKWYHYLIHLGYYIPYWIKFFFSEPFKEKKKDLNILDTVKSLLESETTDGNIKKSKELIHLHRIVENTKARRRLEKWSLRVIALYLFIVLCIVLASYVSIPAIKSYFLYKHPKSYNDNYSFYYNREYNRTRINCFTGTFFGK